VICDGLGRYCLFLGIGGLGGPVHLYGRRQVVVSGCEVADGFGRFCLFLGAGEFDGLGRDEGRRSVVAGIRHKGNGRPRRRRLGLVGNDVGAVLRRLDVPRGRQLLGAREAGSDILVLVELG
jgi:hypothetical protein